MGKKLDLTGQRFGRLTVIEKDPESKGKIFWICRCDCGGTKRVESYRLRSGHVQSCGCLEQENREKRKSISEYIGQKYNYLTILEEVPTKKNELRKVLCKCECGNEKVYFLSNVIRGTTKSCGCYQKAYLREKQTSHGSSNTRLYNVWINIKERCYNPNNTSFNDYGGRGIAVCNEWLNDFTLFEKWAYENGYDKNADYLQCTLDRQDVNGNYCPENCRWVTAAQQSVNKRNNKWFTYDGEKHTISEWAKIKNLKYVTLFTRLKKGWTIEDALNTPAIIGGKNHDKRNRPRKS